MIYIAGLGAKVAKSGINCRTREARDAASPMRRSVAGQIEYWATLGRIAEASGLLPSDAEFVSVDLHEAHAPQHITDPELRSAQARALAEKVQPAKPPTPLVA